MDANIVSFRKLSESSEAVEKFVKDHTDWVVFERNPQNLSADLPVSAVVDQDKINKSVTLTYMPYASVMPLTNTMQ